MCEMCPNNSNSTVQGSAECPCDDGFYRLRTEIDLPCTRELDFNSSSHKLFIIGIFGYYNYTFTFKIAVHNDLLHLCATH